MCVCVCLLFVWISNLLYRCIQIGLFQKDWMSTLRVRSEATAWLQCPHEQDQWLKLKHTCQLQLLVNLLNYYSQDRQGSLSLIVDNLCTVCMNLLQVRTMHEWCSYTRPGISWDWNLVHACVPVVAALAACEVTLGSKILWNQQCTAWACSTMHTLVADIEPPLDLHSSVSHVEREHLVPSVIQLHVDHECG